MLRFTLRSMKLQTTALWISHSRGEMQVSHFGPLRQSINDYYSPIYFSSLPSSVGEKKRKCLRRETLLIYDIARVFLCSLLLLLPVDEWESEKKLFYLGPFFSSLADSALPIRQQSLWCGTEFAIFCPWRSWRARCSDIKQGKIY